MGNLLCCVNEKQDHNLCENDGDDENTVHIIKNGPISSKLAYLEHKGHHHISDGHAFPMDPTSIILEFDDLRNEYEGDIKYVCQHFVCTGGVKL